MRNIEIKSRLNNLEDARKTAESIATRQLGEQRQIDTYFFCRDGRLKLRQIDRLPAQLIWYVRPDLAEAKTSDYLVVPVVHPETLKAALAASLGIRAVVDKRREIFLWHNVRIHLDRVAGLGEFLEFEAVVGPEADEALCRTRLDQLTTLFGVEPTQWTPTSYSDLADCLLSSRMVK